MTVAIRNCPLAASGYPMTATTECVGPKGRFIDDDGHPPGGRGHRCRDLHVHRRAKLTSTGPAQQRDYEFVTEDNRWWLTAVLFDGFELLDVFGPLEVFGVVPQWFSIHLAGPDAGPVRSAQGPAVVADVSYRDATTSDIVLVPGGMGTRRLVNDESFLGWLGDWAAGAEVVSSVCTGSGVLAAAGLLDGRRATSNKLAFAWAVEQGPQVQWVREARWVQDGNRWTSSGVAAGMDMALALVAHLRSEETACAIGNAIEYEWHRDSGWDPFAALNPPAE